MTNLEKKIILILGIRGTGKSTKAKELLSTRSRVLVFDTLCEYNDAEGIICEDMHTLCDTWRKLSINGKNFRLIYQPLDFDQDFPAICELVFIHGDMTFLVEEIDTLFTRAVDYRFLNIVQRGRHAGIELIGVTQRPYAIPPILRSQCKELYTFKQFEDRDINWLKGIIGEIAEQVRKLNQFEFIALINNEIVKGKTQSPGLPGKSKGINKITLPEVQIVPDVPASGTPAQDDLV